MRGVRRGGTGLRGAWWIVLLLPLGARGQALHPDPVHDSPVPLSGAPFYVEGLEVGAPLADFGSHLGVKASVLDKGPLDPNLFLSTVLYSAYTGQAQALDQTFVGFLVSGSAGVLTLFEPAGSRTLQFAPWGWQERVQDRGWSGRGTVTTARHDVFRFDAALSAPAGATGTVTPFVTVAWQPSPVSEFILTQPPSLEAQLEGSALDLKNPFASMTIERVLEGDTAATSWVPDPSYGGTLWFGPLALPPTGGIAWGFTVRGVDPEEGVPPSGATFRLPWEGSGGFFDELPPPHAERDSDRQLYRLAATALRMGVYGPRAAMPATGVVPNKVHFSGFYGWDTAFHSLGLSEFDPALAAANLSLQFAAQKPDGEIGNVVGDDLSDVRFATLGRSQPPVQPWALRAVWERSGGSLDPAWLRDLLVRCGRFLDWWFTARDLDGDGLPGYWTPLESGWDDTPRYPLYPSDLSGLRGIRETRTFDAVDLEAWLYLGMTDLAVLWDEAFPGAPTASQWRRRADLLAHEVEERLWDPALGCYRDLLRTPEGDQRVAALTPALFFPLFAGMTHNAARARTCLAAHLLNPDEFWGDPARHRWPVPTVAFNDPAYNLRQDGYYWQGAVWILTNYTSMQALARYGFEDEARALRRTTLDLMAQADPGGIHETYDARSGTIGWGSEGPGQGSAFQFGWSSVFTLEMLLDRQEAERDWFPDETVASGYLREVRTLPEDEPFYRFEGPGTLPPRVEIERSPSGRLPVRVTLAFSDPYGDLPGPVNVRLPKLHAVHLYALHADGSRTDVPVRAGPGTAFSATPGVAYEVVAGGPTGGSGCSSAPLRGWGSLSAVLGLLFVLRRRGRGLV